MAVSLTGSSPRVRGTCYRGSFPPPGGGLIPAGAGNMLPRTVNLSSGWAHPRGCGEHVCSREGTFTVLGSSPRVRGTFSFYLGEVALQGLIPAGAGNIKFTFQGFGGDRAHPRGCGEHGSPGVSVSSLAGSSPRVRGTCARHITPIAGCGLIPAGAGNIPYVLRTAGPRRAHPRGCGEHGIMMFVSVIQAGSSPRVRGTCGDGTYYLPSGGLIPAGAGNINWANTSTGTSRAHPRGCGEHVLTDTVSTLPPGSSPRVRGTYFTPHLQCTK